MERKGLAITALTVGIVAILTSAVPVLGAVLGVLAIVFGAVALRKKQPKGLSITGLVLGVIATIVSIISTVTLTLFAGQLFSALEESTFEVVDSDASNEEILQQDSQSEMATQPEQASSSSGAAVPHHQLSPSVPIAWHELDTANAPASTHTGTTEDPHPVGSSFEFGPFEIVVNFVDMNATESVLTLAPENDAPAAGERYVLVHATINNPTLEGLPIQNVLMYYDTPKQLYSATVSNRFHMVTPDPALLLEDRNITGSFSGYVVFRTDDVDGTQLRLNSSDRSAEVYVAVE